MSGPPCTGEIIVSAGQCHPENPDSWFLWAYPKGESGAVMAEVCAMTVARGATEMTWRLSALYIPPSWRRKGWARFIIEKALQFIAQNSEGLTPEVFLEAIPYEQDDGPPVITAAELRQFYASLGFRLFPGHPFSMVWEPEKALT
jgi:GNAT superfamily N-acetyltransferase